MQKFDLTFKPMGSQSILIEWPQMIDDAVLDDIIRYTQSIIEHEKNLINYTPGYNSLLLQFNSKVDFNHKLDQLLKIYASCPNTTKSHPKSWDIPVCYDEEFGIDLPLFSNLGLSFKEVEQLHTSKPYRVFMIGFLPGFLYLGGLDKELYIDRKEKPRPLVHKGSIAIGGKQTGIYPMDSPGGWQIIGRTPISIFDLNLDNPCQIMQGDYVQFYSITKSEYQNLQTTQIKQSTL